MRTKTIQYVKRALCILLACTVLTLSPASSYLDTKQIRKVDAASIALGYIGASQTLQFVASVFGVGIASYATVRIADDFTDYLETVGVEKYGDALRDLWDDICSGTSQAITLSRDFIVTVRNYLTSHLTIEQGTVSTYYPSSFSHSYSSAVNSHVLDSLFNEYSSYLKIGSSAEFAVLVSDESTYLVDLLGWQYIGSGSCYYVVNPDDGLLYALRFDDGVCTDIFERSVFHTVTYSNSTDKWSPENPMVGDSRTSTAFGYPLVCSSFLGQLSDGFDPYNAKGLTFDEVKSSYIDPYVNGVNSYTPPMVSYGVYEADDTKPLHLLSNATVTALQMDTALNEFDAIVADNIAVEWGDDDYYINPEVGGTLGSSYPDVLGDVGVIGDGTGTYEDKEDETIVLPGVGTGENTDTNTGIIDTVLDGFQTLWGWLQAIIDAILSLPQSIWELFQERLKNIYSALYQIYVISKTLVSDIVSGIGTVITDALSYLFIPSEGFISEKISILCSNFAFANIIFGLMEGIFDIISGSVEPPKLYIDLGASESEKYTYGGLVCCLDFSFYERYKPYGDAIIGAFMWLFLIWRIFKRLPEIMYGAGMVTDIPPETHIPIPPTGSSQQRIGTRGFTMK